LKGWGKVVSADVGVQEGDETTIRRKTLNNPDYESKFVASVAKLKGEGRRGLWGKKGSKNNPD